MLCICLLCFGMIARGQTDYEYVYWFDGNYATRQASHTNDHSWKFEADVSALDESIHTLHVQVRDTAGLWSSPVTRMFANLRNVSVCDGWYWFDSEDEVTRSTQNVGGLFDVDVSHLDNGLHTIHYMAVDVKGHSTPPVSRTFIKVPKDDAKVTYRCWFDSRNETMVSGQLTDELLWLDVSALDDGLHTVHVQVEKGVDTAPLTFQFLKVPQVIGVDYLHCLCYLDGKLYHQERVSSEGGIVNWELDVNALKLGLHNIQVQVVTPSGAATGLYESMFLRTTTDTELASLKCFYTIDGAESYVEAGTYADGAFHFDLDVSTLDDGLHQLAYMLVGDNGVSTKVSSAFFMKTPLGGNGITQYWYWLNDDDANKTVVKLDERTNPFQLIGLLPVESVPIRSSCFHFEVDEEKGPMLYAKNEFHIRFYDATGRLVDATKEYVDPEVKEKVTEISPLLQTQTLAKPGDNEIRWYQFDAQVGDSIAFKVNKACSINVFAADGTEIYAASGSESVNYGGGVIAEDGSYYVALHDVTTTAETDITLDFFHIGKYVVLDYSPKNVGVTPSVMRMELFGNGYQHLRKVELQRGTTLLTPDSIAVIERTDAQLLFILENGDYERGAYTLKLYFDDGEDSEVVTIKDAIAFEEPIWGDIEVTFTDQRALALPYPVSINVTNTGNVAYSLVPLYFAYDNVNCIQNVKFLDFSIGASKELFEAGYSPTFYTNNLFGKGVSGAVAATLITYLSPGETVSITPGFSANGHTRFTLSAWTGTPWSMMTDDAVAARGSYARTRNYPNSTSCMPDPCEYLSLLDDAADVGNMTECSCALALANIKAFANSFLAIGGRRNRQLNRYYASDFESLGIDFRYQEYELESPGDIIWGLLEHCLGNLGERLSLLREVQDMQNDPAEENCPNRQDYPVEILTPGDPNDIIGFKSVAGSKFVSSDIEDTHYTIRFENDPKLATTSAHVITVRDTLDGRYLDLSTFSPTSVCIGDRMLELNGEKSFTKTLDMRTRINAIAEVSLDYDEAQGIAVWTIRSLDPMTMEETWDYMQGVLPVNSNGEGKGLISFDIRLREGLIDGTKISNRASIVFDNEAAIMTPTWTNIVDGVCPESCVTDVTYKNDSIVTLSIESSDERSGIWKYDLYVQYGVGAPWIKEAELDADSTEVDFKIYDGLYYGFCTLATDSAGNVEQKLLQPEALCAEIHLGDVNSDGVVNERDAQLTMDYYLEKPVAILAAAADVNGDGVVNTLDVTLIVQMYKNAENATESAPIVKHYYTIRKR